MPLPVTDRFAVFVATTDFWAISEKAIENAKLHILDTIGVALVATSSPVGGMGLDYCRSVGGSPEVTIWGSNLKTSPAMAAFTNGLLAHAIDFDDWDAVVHAGHPSCMVLASAVGLGERVGVSGRELLKAYVLGIEIATQIASGTPDIHKRGFHSTPIFGSMGSAAAAASIAGLAKEKIKAAFGIAASGASGIHRQQGSMVKPFHAGNAARNGAEAVLLADCGLTADAAIIENPKGFCDTLFGEATCDYQKMLDGLGDPYYMESPGLGLKLYPCSAPQFLAADATLHLVRQHRITYPEVMKVYVSIPPLRYQRHYHPTVRSGLQGKFAVNYVTAVCVLDGQLARESFTDLQVNNPKVQEALSKVEVVVDEKIPEPGTYCPVAIELRDGRKLAYTATIPKGHPKNPLSKEEVLNKFRDNVKEIISPRRCEELMGCINSLEAIPNIRELTALLVPG